MQLQHHSLIEPLLQPGSTLRPPRGALQTLLYIGRTEGIRSLWKGNVPAEMLYVCYGAIQFSSYRSIAQALQGLNITGDSKKSAAVESFVAGAAAGTFATASTYPLDLLRTRFAAQGTTRVYNGLLSGCRQIAAEEGVKGFFRGCPASLAQIAPYMGLFFAVYEGLRPVMAVIAQSSSDLLHSVSLPILPGTSDATAGVLASIIAKTGVFPLDLVRKRLQVQGPQRHMFVYGDRMATYEKQTMAEVVRQVVRKEGVLGLYRGLTVSLVKAAPASAVTMWTYERTMRVLKSLDADGDAIV